MEPTRYPDKKDQVQFGSAEFSFEEIHAVVDAFYSQVAVDPVLSEPFATVEDWPSHIEKLTHFWWVRFGGGAYLETRYNPVLKHFEAGFNEAFLLRWLTLFNKTLEKTLASEKAEAWISVAQRMGAALSMKNEFMKRNYMHENPNGG